MPKYLDKNCVGACERVGYVCEAKQLYANLAEQYNAGVKQRTVRAEASIWREWVLDVPEETRQEVIDLLEYPHMRKSPAMWLEEFPCHSLCTLTPCAWCGTIHDERYIHEDYCELYQDMRAEEEELYGYVDEDEYMEEGWDDYEEFEDELY